VLLKISHISHGREAPSRGTDAEGNTFIWKGLRQDSLTSLCLDPVTCFTNVEAVGPHCTLWLPCVVALTYYNPTTETRRGRVDDLIQSVQSFSNFDVPPVTSSMPWQTPLLLPLCWRLDARLHAVVRLRTVYTSKLFSISFFFVDKGRKTWRGEYYDVSISARSKRGRTVSICTECEMCSITSYWMQSYK
jgi:hypothetical protein